MVRPRDATQSAALHVALVSLADQDPLIRARATPDGRTSVLLYGEVQKEVIAATLADVYRIEARFAPSEIVDLERPAGVGEAVEWIGHGFAATIGLRIEPGAIDSGIVYRLAVEFGALPRAFSTAIEETVHHALLQGIYGWAVTDALVTLTHSGYWSPISVAGDFRDATPLVVMAALGAARTRVYEPCHRFEAEVPLDRLGPVAARLAQLGARIDETAGGRTSWRVTGEIPARAVQGFQEQLAGMSSGEGMWSSRPSGDRMVVGTVPRRSRTDGNPCDRVEYLRFLAQRTLAAVTG